jgi:hypothetical protein
MLLYYVFQGGRDNGLRAWLRVRLSSFLQNRGRVSGHLLSRVLRCCYLTSVHSVGFSCDCFLGMEKTGPGDIIVITLTVGVDRDVVFPWAIVVVSRRVDDNLGYTISHDLQIGLIN